MLPAPRADLVSNTYDFENQPLVKATGFREYDARWLFGPEINLLGVQTLGLGLGTYIHELGQKRIVVGHDYRSYSLSIKQALTIGLVAAGCEVIDIGLATSPMAYFAQFDLDAPCVAMVTASHNENGWTGVKMGAQRPLTFGPDEMGRLKEIVLSGSWKQRPGGSLAQVAGVAERYIADAASRASISRPLKVVCACGDGTAGAFAPEALRRMGSPSLSKWTASSTGLSPGIIQTPKTASCCTPWLRRCACTTQTLRLASTVTETVAASSMTKARKSSQTRSA